MTDNMTKATRRSGRVNRLISAAALTGAALLGVVAAGAPAQAAPASPARAPGVAAPLPAQWCGSSGGYTACLFGEGGLYAAAATGPVGTVVELIGANGVVLASDRRESWEGQAETGWYPGGRFACVIGGPCATYLD
ncbi:hypothetical protein [Plantactinospora sp. CA-290183]|uniref:hypothetical protein n=1 Tax=Plantactinospora sp. CA-290183 TaxID=3240006 RepID=UPI003D915D5E